MQALICAPTCTTSSTPTQPERRGEMKSGSSSVDWTCSTSIENAMRAGRMHDTTGIRATALNQRHTQSCCSMVEQPCSSSLRRAPGTAAPPPCAGTPASRTAARCSTSPAAPGRQTTQVKHMEQQHMHAVAHLQLGAKGPGQRTSIIFLKSNRLHQQTTLTQTDSHLRASVHAPGGKGLEA